MDGLMPSNKSVTLLPALLREHLPNTIIPTSDPNDPLNRIGTLLQEANRQQSAGHFRDAELSISEARRLAQGHTQALAEIDFFCALSLLEQHKGDEGIQSLSAVLIQHRAWFNTPEGRDLYELLQVQREFSLIHLERKEERVLFLRKQSRSNWISKFGAMFIVISVVAITNSLCTPWQENSLSAPMQSESVKSGNQRFTTTTDIPSMI